MAKLTPKGALRLLRETGVMAIIDDGLRSRAGMLSVCRSLKRSGVRVFQLRCKRTSDRDFLNLALKMRAILKRDVLFINDRCDIAALSSADGVHLGTDDVAPAAARKVAGSGILVGTSAGSRAEVKTAAGAKPDYISVGPVFKTGTKRDAGPDIGAAGFRRLASGIPKRCLRLAVGGITAHNVGVLIRSGADAGAVASWLTAAGSRRGRAKGFLAAVRGARKEGRRSGSIPGRETGRWRG